ncbi:MAG: glycosyltransferase [Desulfovibrio sp.]|nr:glycosyltransferase [Desulfovibrio sp.]
MTVVLFIVGLVQCGLLFLLTGTGARLARRAQKEREEARYVPHGGWPRVAMIIPAAGNDPRMEAALKSLLEQDYPHLLPVLVTSGADDPAADIIRRLKEDYPALRHVIAGEAKDCGQKNWNSLAGVGAVGDAADIYMFCDSTHMADPEFARCLVGPLARNEAAFSTGYHEVEPRDHGLVTLGYALSVLLMRLLQGVSAFTQPWGGAMAMTRAAFERYGVARLWASTVVDDCSLGAMLEARGVHVKLCAAALLRTTAHRHAFGTWRAWMDRQVLFLKFCMPGQWLLLGVFAALMLAPSLWAGFIFCRDLIGRGGGTGPFLALLWLLLLAGTLSGWRRLVPVRVPLGRWLGAFFLASGLFGWVYLRTIPARTITWRHMVYLVGRGGVLLGMRRRG